MGERDRERERKSVRERDRERDKDRVGKGLKKIMKKSVGSKIEVGVLWLPCRTVCW